MRRLTSLLLLLILGCLLPAAGSPLRYCLLEQRIVVAQDQEAPRAGQGECCDSCHAGAEHQEGTGCCLEVKHLPDTGLPAASDKVPAFQAVTLPEAFEIGEVEVASAPDAVIGWCANEEIPPRFARERAVLGKWTV